MNPTKTEQDCAAVPQHKWAILKDIFDVWTLLQWSSWQEFEDTGIDDELELVEEFNGSFEEGKDRMDLLMEQQTDLS